MIALALGLWQLGERPAVLIADTGGLVGVMTEQGRALSREKGAGFVARNWLENDGDGVTQDIAAARWSTAQFSGFRLLHISGKRAIAGFEGCARGDIVVMNGTLEGPVPPDCLIIDPGILQATGALALVGDGSTARLVSARDRGGDRMWSGWARHPHLDLALPDVTDTLARTTK